MVQISYWTQNSYGGINLSLYKHYTKESNENIQNAITEVSKGDCIVMGDFNHGNIQWDTLESRGVEDQRCMCLIQEHFLTQHVLGPIG